MKVVCISNFPSTMELINPEIYVPQVRHRCKLVEEDRKEKIRKEEEEMAIMKKVMPQEIPDLPILVARVGTKVEQHSPSPEPERRNRFPRVYVASFGLEVAGKCKDPPKEPEIQQALRQISKWEWSEFYKQVLK